MQAFKNLTPCGFFLRLTNLPYVVDAEINHDGTLSMLHRVYSPDGNNIQNLPEANIDEIHEELNRGRYNHL